MQACNGVRRGCWHSALFLTLWEVATAKLAWLPLPFFPPPQSIIEVYTDDLPKLLDSIFASVKLQLGGYVDRRHRRLPDRRLDRLVAQRRLLGASGAAVHRPAAGNGLAAARLLHLSVELERQHVPDRAGDRVSGHGADLVRRGERQQRLLRRRANARRQAAFLVLKVAIPAALPHVFVGLFMGLGSSFAVLVVAEMIGVKAGLGWYLQWAQGWAAYANMYAALIVMSLMCSGAITLLFRTRDRLLVWQKGVVKW